MLGLGGDSASARRLRRKNNHMPAVSRAAAAAPMAMPAMAPPDRLEEDPPGGGVGAGVEDVAVEDVAVEDVVEDTGVVGSTGVGVLLWAVELVRPYGCTLEYTSHWASGAARGHSFARQMEYSWPSTGGEHRILYLAFIKAESVAASVSEKP